MDVCCNGGNGILKTSFWFSTSWLITPFSFSATPEKRVQAFSVDQEQKIRVVWAISAFLNGCLNFLSVFSIYMISIWRRMFFGRFKDHRRCSYMIANELRWHGQHSAAQVSRKLKQLGLVLHKQKRSDTNFHLRDEGSNDMSSKSNLMMKHCYLCETGANTSLMETIMKEKNRRLRKNHLKAWWMMNRSALFW